MQKPWKLQEALEDIILASDVVMVARGDLGVPLSTIIGEQLAIHFENLMADDYASYFAIFEHLLGLFYNYFIPMVVMIAYGDCVPSGEYFWRKIDLHNNEDDIFCSFFKQLKIKRIMLIF